MGDPAGIGGELILKALNRLTRRSIPVIVGDTSILYALNDLLFHGGELKLRPLGRGSAGQAEIVDVGALRQVRFGTSDASCGDASYRYIMKALELVFSGVVSAIVTCPINKKSIQAAGIPFIGHTALLARYGGVSDYVMMMMNRTLRVSLVTIHVPLKDVPSLVTTAGVLKCIAVTHRALHDDFGLANPSIKVCGLNPHAGEQGVIGTEESVIAGAIDAARAAGMNVEGPFPAASLFHRIDADGYIAMYHDQGLIPVKTMDFRRTVNVTLGLPFVRTSVGHGTGLDIAGKGEADETSLIEAYRTAESMADHRARTAR
jgi:4-hydroxythreonine-4-phosphate dehydrogenase